VRAQRISRKRCRVRFRRRKVSKTSSMNSTAHDSTRFLRRDWGAEGTSPRKVRWLGPSNPCGVESSHHAV
jgi:hypothetical protein